MDNRVPKFPDRKISETLLHFARVTPESLPTEVPERRAREALTVASTVWNAVIFADVLNDDQHLNEVFDAFFVGTSRGGGALVEQLIARKRTMFADDERLIGNFEVTRTEEGINVHAEAHDPHSLPRDRA